MIRDKKKKHSLRLRYFIDLFIIFLFFTFWILVNWQVESGLKDDLVLGDPNAPRFVLWDGKLRAVPSKPTDLPLFDLMSIGGKLRAGFGALGIRPPPPVCSLLPPLGLLHSDALVFLSFLIQFLIWLNLDKGDRVMRNQLKSLFGVILVMRFLNA